jgi:diguanylate cyclase (GGDEF)-like protein/PAS domain S-box-containing protein
VIDVNRSGNSNSDGVSDLDDGEWEALLAALRDEAERVQGFSLSLGVIQSDTSLHIVEWNSGAERLFGYSREEVIGRTVTELVVPETERRAFEEFQTAQGETRTLENTTRDGRTIVCEWHHIPLVAPSGEAIGISSVVRDITAQRNNRIAQTALEERWERVVEALRDVLRSSRERFRLLTESAPDIITIVSPDGMIRYESGSVERILGFRPEERIGKDALTILHPDDVAMIRQRMDACLNLTDSPMPSAAAVVPLVYRMQDKEGRWRWFESVWNNLLDHPAVNGILVFTRDVTDQRAAEDQMHWQALHDPLTRLPNRTFFYQCLQEALVACHVGEEIVAVLFLDLDRFKHINDTLGHDTGDEVLKAVAERLLNCLPPGASVARMGGDEFTVLLPRTDGPETAMELARTLLDCLQPPFSFGHFDLYVGGSIGIATFPEDVTNIQTLLKHADVAMYRAKELRTGGMLGSYQLYNAAMNAQSLDRLMLQNRLAPAITQGEFELWYQPQIDARSGRLIGMEALVRWEHPNLGLLEPERFIPVAEETGLVVPLGEWVIRAACEQAAAWRKAGRSDVTVAVNLSAWHFRRPGFAAFFREVLERTGLEAGQLNQAGQLNLELTETVLMEGKDLTVETLTELKQLGIRLSVDDFGTGYSSLAYLRQFPLDILKIDRAFVRNIATNETDRAVIKALIELAHALNLSVVAEGVETEDQIYWLKDLGCDVLQGYHLGRPVPAKDMESLWLV